MPATETIHTTCCIAGGGPAGMMLGFLLARAGVAVVVVEKHKDFLRDFRGDTIHPSTLELMYELGLLEEFLKLPHQKVQQVGIQIGDDQVTIGDLRRPTASSSLSCPNGIFWISWPTRAAATRSVSTCGCARKPPR